MSRDLPASSASASRPRIRSSSRDSLVEAYRRRAEARELPAPAGAVRLGPHPRGHEARLHARSSTSRRSGELRAVRPDISLSSDFIVGFPGETEARLPATLELIADVGFDQSFSFIYSRRPGTPAASLPDDVPHDVKQKRLKSCRRRSTAQARRISESMVGSMQRVLVEKPSRRDPRAARGPHREHALGELRRSASRCSTASPEVPHHRGACGTRCAAGWSLERRPRIQRRLLARKTMRGSPRSAGRSTRTCT